MTKIYQFPIKVSDSNEKDEIIADLKQINDFVSANFSIIEDTTENEEMLFRHFKKYIEDLITKRDFIESEITEYINTVADYQNSLDVFRMDDIIIKILVYTEMMRLFPRKFVTYPDDLKDALISVFMENDISCTQYTPIGKVLLDIDLFNLICKLCGENEDFYDYYEMLVTELDLNHKKEVVMPVIMEYLNDVFADMANSNSSTSYTFATLDDAYYVFDKCVIESLKEDGFSEYDENDLENLNNFKKCTLLDNETKIFLKKGIDEILGTDGVSDTEATKKVLKLVGDYYRKNIEFSKVIHVDFRR